jgi:hypothetical protein
VGVQASLKETRDHVGLANGLTTIKQASEQCIQAIRARKK